MSTLRAEPGWADVLLDCAADHGTADRLIRQLNAAHVASLAFCRLLERWGRGDAAPSTPGARQAALRRAADRAESALTRHNTESMDRRPFNENGSFWRPRTLNRR